MHKASFLGIFAAIGLVALTAAHAEPAHAFVLDASGEKVEKKGKPSPRDGSHLSVTLPVGRLGVGTFNGGFTYGVGVAFGGRAVSLPVYVLVGSHSVTVELGVRYSAPRLFFVEGLLGVLAPVGERYSFSKDDPSTYVGAGVGIGLGLDIPVYKRFTVTVGGEGGVGYRGDTGPYGLAYLGPTLHI